MVKLNKIYTRTGDDGTTGLVDGSRIAKSGALMAAIGDVDEANSWVGLAAAALDPARDEAAMLSRIQNELFDLGADLATPPDIQFGFGPHDKVVGTDLPGIDFVALATGLGCPGVRISDPTRLGAVLAEALTSGRPNLVEVRVA